METLSAVQFQALVQHGTALKRMRQGVKVWRLADGRIVKLFRPRGRFSRSRLYPPNRRFARNARRLCDRGFVTVQVERLFFNRDNDCYAVVYPELPGLTLEALLTTGTARSELLRQLAALMARLHRAGVVFRSLHLGNLLLSGGELALIDVQELTIRPWPLGVGARVRNFAHLLRREQDQHLLAENALVELLQVYLAESGLSAAAQTRLQLRVRRLAQPRRQTNEVES